jgi:LemA protein
MTHTVLFWLLPAVLLFWALGAYNRLVRLRAQVIAAFLAVDNRLSQALTLVTERIALVAGSGATDAGASSEIVADGWSVDSLRGAAIQLEVALRVVRRYPLDAPSVAALRTARATMQTLWERKTDPASPDLAPNQRAWEDHQQVAGETVNVFNQCVNDYNQAIAQFPAAVLAYFFGFRPAEGL